MAPATSGAITDVPGISVGQFTDAEHGTGCSVVLCADSAVGGIDVRGGAPGGRDTELLHPLAAGERVNGFVLTGGSVFGLAAADGATRYLAEHDRGIPFGGKTIPLCPAAVIFDLGVVTSRVHPGADAGYAACESAGSGMTEGSVGAGTGATVGGLLGPRQRTKGGIGTASVRIPEGPVVGAVMVVNALGSIVDPHTGTIVAGPRAPGESSGFEDSAALVMQGRHSLRGARRNTVIGVIATDAALSKKDACRLAGAGQDGITLAVRPSHTSFDGDTVFAMATGEWGEFDVDRLRAAATMASVNAILSAIHQATGLSGIPSAREHLQEA